MSTRDEIAFSRRPAGIIPALPLDLACLCAFVLLGRQSHDVGGGIVWFFTVLWPFVVGWMLAAAIFQVYTRTVAWWRIVAAVVGSVAIAIPLRALVTGRGVAPAFVIVAIAFNLAAMGGWRLVMDREWMRRASSALRR